VAVHAQSQSVALAAAQVPLVHVPLQHDSFDVQACESSMQAAHLPVAQYEAPSQQSVFALHPWPTFEHTTLPQTPVGPHAPEQQSPSALHGASNSVQSTGSSHTSGFVTPQEPLQHSPSLAHAALAATQVAAAHAPPLHAPEQQLLPLVQAPPSSTHLSAALHVPPALQALLQHSEETLQLPRSTAHAAAVAPSEPELLHP
jgi:hypothetical protein